MVEKKTAIIPVYLLSYAKKFQDLLNYTEFTYTVHMKCFSHFSDFRSC